MPKKRLPIQEKRKLGRKRLRRLAKFLRESVPKLRFDMSIYGDTGFTEGKCGTSACALGWATVCFPRSGIKMVEHGFDEDAAILFKGVENIDAAVKFFHLDLLDADDLFCGNADVTPKQKAKQIEEFLEESKMVNMNSSNI